MKRTLKTIILIVAVCLIQYMLPTAVKAVSFHPVNPPITTVDLGPRSGGGSLKVEDENYVYQVFKNDDDGTQQVMKFSKDGEKGWEDFLTIDGILVPLSNQRQTAVILPIPDGKLISIVNGQTVDAELNVDSTFFTVTQYEADGTITEGYPLNILQDRYIKTIQAAYRYPNGNILLVWEKENYGDSNATREIRYSVYDSEFWEVAGFTQTDVNPFGHDVCTNKGELYMETNMAITGRDWSSCYQWCTENMTEGASICEYYGNDNPQSCRIYNNPAEGINSCTWEVQTESPTNSYPSGEELEQPQDGTLLNSYYGESNGDEFGAYFGSIYDTYRNLRYNETKVLEDGSIMLTYEIREQNGDHKVYIQKFNEAGEAVFPDGGISYDITEYGDNFTSDYRFYFTNDGGWYRSTGGYTIDQLQGSMPEKLSVQYYNPSGEAQWEGDGITLADETDKRVRFLAYSNGYNEFTVVWSLFGDYDPDTDTYTPNNLPVEATYYQAITTSGEILRGENGVLVGDSSSMGYSVKYYRDGYDGFLVLWYGGSEEEDLGYRLTRVTDGGAILSGGTGTMIYPVSYPLPIGIASFSLFNCWNRERSLVCSMQDNAEDGDYFLLKVRKGNQIKIADDLTTYVNGLNIEFGSEYGITEVDPVENTVDITTETDIQLAEVDADLSNDRDWTSIVGTTDTTNAKSFIDGVLGAEGVTADEYTIFTPKRNLDDTLVICPHAQSIVEVTTMCEGSVKIKDGQSKSVAFSEGVSTVSVEQVTIEGVNYWKAENVIGSSGAASVKGTSTVQTPTTPVNNPGTNYQPVINDTTPPTTTVIGIDNEEYYSTVTITFECSDEESGCATTYYTLDGSTPTTSSLNGTSITITEPGEYILKFFSVDKDGNRENIQTVSHGIKILKETPVQNDSETKNNESKGNNKTPSKRDDNQDIPYTKISIIILVLLLLIYVYFRLRKKRKI